MDRSSANAFTRELRKVARPILVGNPDIVAPRGRYLSLEPGYYGHKLGSELKIQAKFFGKPLQTSMILLSVAFPISIHLEL